MERPPCLMLLPWQSMTRGGEVEGEQVKLIPRFLFDDIYAIDPSWLRAQGVRLLLADLDNTLIPYGEKLPPASVRTWKEGLEAQGIRVRKLDYYSLHRAAREHFRRNREPLGCTQRVWEELGVFLGF